MLLTFPWSVEEDHDPLAHEAPWVHEEAAQSQAPGHEDQSCEALEARVLGTGEVHGAQAGHSEVGHLVHRVHWGLGQMGMVVPRSRVCLVGTDLGND